MRVLMIVVAMVVVVMGNGGVEGKIQGQECRIHVLATTSPPRE